MPAMESSASARAEIDPETLKTRIESLDVSARTQNALSNANIRTVGGLARKKEVDLEDIEGFIKSKGLDGSVNKLAEAKEYRQTISVRQALQKGAESHQEVPKFPQNLFGAT